MKNILKSKYDLQQIRISGKITADVLKMIQPYIVPDISTKDINDICHNYITHVKKSIPACLGYNNFPKSICISVNDVVCHGIPNKKLFLKNGDIVNIDVSVIKNNYYADASKMFLVGLVTNKHKLLCKITQNSLYLSLKCVKHGVKINKIGYIIQKYVEKNKFSIVKEYCGHGIGKNFHELPYILHFYNKNDHTIMQKNMVFTIEPMVNEKSSHIQCMKDGWTVKTQDGGLSAQYEHTILVTDTGCEVITHQENEKIPKIFINI
ncbi:Methionine aminopeptidase [Buchnera aphidicola (Cinara kochiana kochiana)]|uniref:Methionine aminopeptidase n=1 Tax=Buchnera aphidicola (Cinara kochiana kochiana) TaxID=2518976 RepID=A0A451D5H1_9GAMM|nr:type I methionyl aminopeptidase [Buchnera aphidicola]VFP81066.1 Methionine aminopeptidase [Buchnera aphidicola (Cinara kochiana kochiana)]